ncbi:MAG: serine/threonine protein kinase [Deltaproteobacteria bacterium]|nr:serine/threonine protein kinase [Deltaproteobacteria bacterium]
MAEAHAFGRYKVTGTLGAGGMGEVYAAVDEVLGREVAVKTLRGKHTGLAARLLDDRFRQEARAIAALAHPGIVQVFDIDLTAEPPYIVMERVAGPSLKERLASGPLEIHELRALGIQIARALVAAHAAGIVHRDVKPANILAATGGAWKLADFGVAHVPDSAITMTGQFVGSPAYAPPEALIRGQTGPAGDIYGLGATMYEAAAGRWPRADATSGALLGPVPPLRQLAPHIPLEVADAIDRAVSVEPEARPSASDLADALAGASSQPGAVVMPAASVPGMTVLGLPSGPLSVAARRRVPWKPIAIAIGVVLLIGTVAAISSRSPNSAPVSSPAPGDKPVDTPADKPPEEPQPPGELRVITPEIATKDRRAGKDWNKLVDKLHDGKLGEATKKLSEFERKWGESEESKSLRAQLGAMPASHDDDD